MAIEAEEGEPVTVVHVSEVDTQEETGMGRVAWHWRNAFRRRGHDFLEVGPAQMGRLPHKALQPFRAYRASRNQCVQPDVYVVHEPLAAPFVASAAPTVVVSHGLERRKWMLSTSGIWGEADRPSLRTRLLFPLWRLRSCDVGMRKADLALLINSEDAAFAERFYKLPPERYRVFRNGINPEASTETSGNKVRATASSRVLFIGTWCPRKGTKSLAAAARQLFARGLPVSWVLAGTGHRVETVQQEWPAELAGSTQIIPRFPRAQEKELFAGCDVFVLPSLYEGQPLALLQAMEAGRCCVVSNCCGQKDLIRHDQNGLLHPPGDAAALAATLEYALRSPGLSERLGNAARSSVEDRRWENVSEEVVNHVEALCADRRSRRERVRPADGVSNL
jgi:glycosyltransferase involved in cell wall biosynthesis